MIAKEEELQPLVADRRLSMPLEHHPYFKFMSGVVFGAGLACVLLSGGPPTSMPSSDAVKRVEVGAGTTQPVRLTSTPKHTTHGLVLEGQPILSGNPATEIAVQFEGTAFEVGSWTCQVGAWQHEQAGDEFIELVEVLNLL
jgi:hypothetical protein